MRGQKARSAVSGSYRHRSVAIAVACAFLLTGLVGSQSAHAALLHEFSSYFGSGMSKPEALAVDQTTGDVYVLERENGCISRFKGRGGEALSPDVFPATGTNKICGLVFRQEVSTEAIAIDNSGTSTEGTIYVNTGDESPTGGVQEYDRNGNHIGNLPVRNPGAFDCGAFTEPDGTFYDSEYYTGFMRYKHNTPITDADYEGGPYVGPECDIAIDSVGNKYWVFPPNGPLIRQQPEKPYGFFFSELAFAISMDPGSDDLYVSEGAEVAGFSREGIVFDHFGAGKLTESRGVAVDEVTGVAYASDTENGRIAVFSGAPAYRVAVEPLGTGFGAISADRPPVSACGDEGQCTGFYTAGPLVLTATPQPHSVVEGWTGCDSVNLAGNECTVNVGEERAVVANFTRLEQPLTVSTTGTGTGSVSTPNNLGLIKNCGNGGICTGPYDEGSVVTLIPTPTGHSSFTGWSGACTNATGNCEIVMEDAESVTAHFTAQHAISVSKGGTGAGSVDSSNGKLSCGGTCTTYFTDGEAVVLSATAAAHSSFVGWSGEGCSGAGTCEVTAEGGTKKVTATFAHEPPTGVTESGATYTGQHAGTVHGNANPDGAQVTSCVFEYGTSTAYGSQVQCAPSDVGSGESPVEVGANLTNLAPSTTYHYRLSATSAGGTGVGADRTFTTLTDTCDTNAALCPPHLAPPVTHVTCKKGFALKNGHCVKKKSHRKKKRHQSRGGAK